MEKLKSKLLFRRQRPTNPGSSNQEGLLGRGKSDVPTVPQWQGAAQPLSSRNSSAQSFPDGVEVLHDCHDAVVDVCFVHGLTGDRRRTWTAEQQFEPWPKKLLPLKLEKARILTYGYDAYVVARRSVASVNQMNDHAANMLHDLTASRASAASRPLIFVAHSLGGLVCKEAIMLSRNSPEAHLRGVFEHTKAIAFMGTPHAGSWMANWARFPASALGILQNTSTTLLKVLETDDELLRSMQRKFWQMIREQREGGRRLEITCFFEELPMSRLLGPVVSRDSAVLEGYSAVSIHANHRDMVRFGSIDDNGFKRLLGELLRWQAEVMASALRERPEIEVRFPATRKFVPSMAREECLRSLAFDGMNDRFNDINSAVDGTCQWLFQHSIHIDRVKNKRGLLWIKGNPGSGKSTLLKHVLQQALATQNAGDTSLVLWHFFHDRGNALQKTPLGLWRHVVWQVLKQVNAPVQILLDTFTSKCREQGKPEKYWQWHPDELWAILGLCLQQVLATQSVWLFVDALDESGRENAITVIRQCNKLLSTPSVDGLHQFHVCFTCRHYPSLHLSGGFEISMEKENKHDIETYVRTQLAEFQADRPSQILELILDRAQGIFLWAYLVVKKVLVMNLDGMPLMAIREEVLRTPQELEDLYNTLLSEMDKDSLNLFQWVSCAIEPLLLDELRWIMAMKVDYADGPVSVNAMSPVTPEEGNRTLQRRIQKLSCGLIEVIAHTKVTQFIHQSVKDFFLDSGLVALTRRFAHYTPSSVTAPRNSEPGVMALNVLPGQGERQIRDDPSGYAVGLAHYWLCRICIRYLDTIDATKVTEYNTKDYPLLFYAMDSWQSHAVESQGKGVPQDDLLSYFNWPSNNLVLKLALLNPKLEYCDAYNEHGQSLIHVLSCNGLAGPLLAILQSGKQLFLNAQDVEGRTPLMMAVTEGHLEIVRTLLEHGARLDVPDAYHTTPLNRAAIHGFRAVVQLLLDSGADVNLRTSENGNTTLVYAIRGGYLEIVRLLLNRGANIELEGPDPAGSPLLHAAGHGNLVLVELLLDRGADIDSRTGPDGITPLALAASEGRTDVMRVLLDHGAQLEAKDRKGRTPLFYSVCSRDKSSAELLLSRGASREAVDEQGYSAISFAAHYDSTETRPKYGLLPRRMQPISKSRLRYTVLKLLDLGANIEGKDSQGRTPLLWAAETEDKETMVKALLEKGADTEAVNQEGLTPLMLAVRHGRKVVIQHLRLHNAQPLDSTKLATALGSDAESKRQALLGVLTEGHDTSLARYVGYEI